MAYIRLKNRLKKNKTLEKDAGAASTFTNLDKLLCLNGDEAQGLKVINATIVPPTIATAEGEEESEEEPVPQPAQITQVSTTTNPNLTFSSHVGDTPNASSIFSKFMPTTNLPADLPEDLLIDIKKNMPVGAAGAVPVEPAASSRAPLRRFTTTNSINLARVSQLGRAEDLVRGFIDPSGQATGAQGT